MDGGSNPPSSTKYFGGLDPSRPLNPFPTKAYSQLPLKDTQGSKGLEKSPKCLENDSFGQPAVTKADIITRDIGTRQCQLYRQKFFNTYEPICYEVAHEYLRITAKQSYVEANRFLNNLKNELQIHDLNLTSDLQHLSAFADKMASLCGRIYSTYGENVQHCISACSELFLRYRLTPPDSHDERLFAEKVVKSRLWFRKLKQLAMQTLEHVRRQCSIVNNEISPYCSDAALNNWLFEQEQSKDYMENTYIQNELGDRLSLAEVAEHNVSNPKIRRCEMMVRIRGFEEVAMINGHVGDFYTLTTPSKMHSHHKNGRPNNKYNGTTTKQANEYMQTVWQRIRAKLDRDNLKIYGIRVVEPHHDSTPHWHLMLFMHPKDRKQIQKVIAHYALEEDGNEPGAKEYRVKCTEIDPAKGSAAGYIAKYIAKNIDGEYLESDNYGNDAKNSAKRITAWASLNRIRQFQFIGGPSVTLWRELRKLKDDYPEELEPYASPANKADWAAFVLAMGGANLPRSNRPLHLQYDTQESESIDHLTGEISYASGRCDLKHISGFKVFNTFIPIIKRNWSLILSPSNIACLTSAPLDGAEASGCEGGSRGWRKGALFRQREELPPSGAFLGLV